MSKHEEFEELCALAATGQLSTEDELRLNEHLENCRSCRAVCEDFAMIFREIPASECGVVDRDVVRQIDTNKFRESFLARARADGRRFSDDAQKGPSNKWWRMTRLLPAYQGIALGAMVALVLGVAGYRALHHAPKTDAGKVNDTVVESRPAAGPSDEFASRVSELQLANDASQKMASELKAENGQLVARLQGLEKELGASQAVNQDLQRTMSRVSEMNAQLAVQMDQNTQLLAQTKTELETARTDRAAMQAQVISAKSEVNDLSEQVRLQTASLDRDRELLFAGRDITNLMGARNLHIIDVHDADSSGKDRKSFGRVFYTEGKSLIFYAFDLDERKVVNAKYTFEAWGEHLGQPASVKSLGVLYADDKD